jgi:hypothetical protein
MKLDLQKIFVLDLDFEKGKRYGGRDTSEELNQSLEKFFNIFDRDPDCLIRLMDAAVEKEVKERMLLILASTELTPEDGQNYRPVTEEDIASNPQKDLDMYQL